MRKIIYSENAPKPIGPYSQAVQAGNTFYFSGQIGLDPKTGSFDSETDVEVQSKRVMSNIAALLEEAGLDWNHVVKTSIFLKDMNDFPKVNAMLQLFADDFGSQSQIIEFDDVQHNQANE